MTDSEQMQSTIKPLMKKTISRGSKSSFGEPEKKPITPCCWTQKVFSDLSSLLVSVVIGGKAWNCLVDTEASVSVISHKWLETFSGEQSQLDIQIDSLPEGFALKNVGGSNIHVTGSLSLVMRMSEWTISHTFVVADVDIPGPILGIDFLSQHAVVLDLKEGLLRWAGGSVSLKAPSVGLFFLAVRHSFTMLDTSRRMIKGQGVDSEGRPYCLTGARVIEPNAGFVDKAGVMVARELVDGEQGKVPVQLWNLRDTTL